MFHLKDIKIRKKLVVSFLGFALSASLAGAVALMMMIRIDRQYSAALENYGFVQGDVGSAMLMIAEERAISRDIVGTQPGADTSSLQQELVTIRQQYDDYVAEMRDDLVTAQEQKLYSDIQSEFSSFQQKTDEFVQRGLYANAAEKTRILTEMLNQQDPVYDQLLADYQELMDLKVNSGDDLSIELTAQSNTAVILVLTVLGVVLVVSCIYGTWLSHRIADPLEKCADRLQKLSHGDLQTPVPEIDSKDETGMIGEATDTVVKTIRDIITEISWALGEIGSNNLTVSSKRRDLYVGDYSTLQEAVAQILTQLTDTILLIDQSSDQVNAGASQVSDGAQALSQGATEQASTVEELSSTLQETTRQIEQSAESASKAKEVVQRVGREIGDSNAKMGEMITAMNEINAKSSEIGKIIKTIDDIAFQTNILALNAAVEAARAGSAGKGFAVVADEVRNLAGKSADAAKNTQSLIEETINAVEKGASLAKTTEESMVTVVEGARHVIDIIDNISTAADEQADSIRQLKTAVEQISNVTQTTAATAEESAAACEELSAQSQALKTLVGKFQLKR